MPGYAFFLMLHIAAGVLALASFWCAALLRKGAAQHRAAGKVFLVAMAVIVITSLPITLEFALYRQRPLSALFLAYLMALTANGVWMAWRAVTDRRDWRVLVARPGWSLTLWPLALLAFGVLVGGLLNGQPLMITFSLIGLWASTRMWRFARRGPVHANWALRQHYQSMLGAGIATHVAFLGIGMRPFWRWLQAHTVVPATLIELFPWLAPVLVAVVIGRVLNKRYGGKAAAALH